MKLKQCIALCRCSLAHILATAPVVIAFVVIVYATVPVVVRAETSSVSSVLDIPAGTTFELTRELEIKPNRNYQVIGRDHLQESFNTLHQPGNDYAGRMPGYRGSHLYPSQDLYPSYDLYVSHWRKTVDQSYQDCLNRHRIYYHHSAEANRNSTIVSQGDGNTNIIINGPGDSLAGSVQGPHNCIIPQHTLTLLLTDIDQAEAGRAFREGHKFTVRKVRHQQHGHFHSITIYFDHDVAEGLRIVSTRPPQDIYLYQLQQQSSEEGFWSGVGAAIMSTQHIAGQLFTIKLPEKRYYD